MPRGNIKAFEHLMYCVITKENTLLRSKLKLPLIVGAQISPTSTTENSERAVVRSCVEEALERCATIKDFSKKAIN
jgi:hypothetical protein